MPRRIDHCVLPTASLDMARARLSALGFSVAPNGRHPFGTENCCVYLPDGTFLEPLAVADKDEVRSAIHEGNVFVARDDAYRTRLGDDGFSALVFASDDAERDHSEFVSAGISAGQMLTFSRPFRDAAGNTGIASFKLAFAAAPGLQDGFFFACQRLNAPAVDRSALEMHPNGVMRLKSVGVEATSETEVLLATVTGSRREKSQGGPFHRLTDAGIFVRLPAGGLPGLRFRQIAFEVASLDALERILLDNGIDHRRSPVAIEVPAAPGQGAEFSFHEHS